MWSCCKMAIPLSTTNNLVFWGLTHPPTIKQTLIEAKHTSTVEVFWNPHSLLHVHYTCKNIHMYTGMDMYICPHMLTSAVMHKQVPSGAILNSNECAWVNFSLIVVFAVGKGKWIVYKNREFLRVSSQCSISNSERKAYMHQRVSISKVQWCNIKEAAVGSKEATRGKYHITKISKQ